MAVFPPGDAPWVGACAYGASIQAFAGTERIATLRNITLKGCRGLQRFEGPGANVTWTVVNA